jgi:hypothetical protein
MRLRSGVLVQASRPRVLPLGDPVVASVPNGRLRRTRRSSPGTLRTHAFAQLTAKWTASELWSGSWSEILSAGCSPLGPGRVRGGVISFFDLPDSATRVMFYVAVGIAVVVAVTLIGLVVYRGRPDNGSGFG